MSRLTRIIQSLGAGRKHVFLAKPWWKFNNLCDVCGRRKSDYIHSS